MATLKKDAHSYDPSFCKECGSPFMSRRDSIKKGMGKYCSKSCQVKAQHRKGTNKASRKLEKHHNWQGGFYIDSWGYKLILMPDHPNCLHNGYILEHRYVMSEHLGRPLTSDEVVHHIDGIVLNNSIENLYLTNRSEHMKIHRNHLDNNEVFSLLPVLEPKKKFNT